MTSKPILLGDDEMTSFFDIATSADYRKALSGYGLDMVALDTVCGTDELIAFTRNGRQMGVGKIHHLEWDSQFFGVKSARIESLYFVENDSEPYDTRVFNRQYSSQN